MTKDERIQEVKAVLDLTEEEQIKFITRCVQKLPYEHIEQHGRCAKCGEKAKDINDYYEHGGAIYIFNTDCSEPNPLEESLADLAFRMRDEAIDNISSMRYWYEALVVVATHKHKAFTKCISGEDMLIKAWRSAYQFITFFNGIEIICLSLIAKILSEDDHEV